MALPPDLWRYALPIAMLLASNVFMNLAWYGHLKFKAAPLWMAILAAWSIALVEYCLAIPANRIGAEVYSPGQLKTIQEVATLTVFLVFAWLYFGETPTWSHAVGFALIAAGAAVVFLKPLG